MFDQLLQFRSVAECLVRGCRVSGAFGLPIAFLQRCDTRGEKLGMRLLSLGLMAAPNARAPCALAAFGGEGAAVFWR